MTRHFQSGIEHMIFLYLFFSSSTCLRPITWEVRKMRLGGKQHVPTIQTLDVYIIRWTATKRDMSDICSSIIYFREHVMGSTIILLCQSRGCVWFHDANGLSGEDRMFKVRVFFLARGTHCFLRNSPKLPVAYILANLSRVPRWMYLRTRSWVSVGEQVSLTDSRMIMSVGTCHT